MSPQLNESTRIKIRTLSIQGWSERRIARALKVNCNTVKLWKHRTRPDNVENIAPGRGRKRKFDPEQQQELKQFLEQHAKEGSRSLTPLIKKRFKLDVTDRTVRLYSARFGFKWKRPQKKPFLLERHKKERVRFAKKHATEDWTKWVFSDEKTFIVGPRSSGQRVKEGEVLLFETIKHPAKVHCWWAISAKAEFEPYLFTENLTGDLYTTILMTRLLHPTRGSLGRGWTLQQDNDPKHRSKVAQEWLNSNTPYWTSDWPPVSPDLNPIENLWSEVADKVAQKAPKIIADLKKEIQKVCLTFPRTHILNAIESMHSRLEAVVAAKGGHTKY